jgi:hypothetical protein
VAFEVIAAGDPRIRIAEIRARDAANRRVEVGAPIASEPVPQRIIPAVTGIARPVPNPFRESTAFTVSLAQSGPVHLTVYSLDGRRVRTLLDEAREAGEYHVTWDGRDAQGSPASPGVYFVRLAAGPRTYSQTIVYLR